MEYGTVRNMVKSRGALIVIEGLDRAGKSTQCERLSCRLEREGHDVKRMRFPDRSTAIGKLIDKYLKGESQQEDHVVHLLFSANRWEAAAQIRADIEHGTTIVIDRYYYSGIVYSAAKLQPDLSLEWARKPEVGLPRPDVWFFLKIAPKNVAARGGFGAEKYETRKMQERVEEMFRQLSETSDGGDMRTIDAGGELNEVEDAIWAVVEATLRDPRMTEPLGSVGP